MVLDRLQPSKNYKEVKKMYHGRFNGSHYHAGFKWGQLLRKNGIIINGSPTFTLTEEMRQFSKDCMPDYKKYYPEILDEIKGIADGQEISFDLLSTILISMYCFKFDNRCTCFAFNANGKTVFGRNSDFLVSLEKLYMNCLYRLDGVYSFNGNTTAYVEIEDGVNECGLAVGLTFVYPHIRGKGFNAGMLVRYLLEKCKTTEEAIVELKRLPIASPQTITLADRNGYIAVVECNPENIVVILPRDGEEFVATANNFNSQPMLKYRNPAIDDWCSDDRYRTVMLALKENKNKYSIEFAKDLLSGKYGFICQYDRKTNADTVWSVVYDLTEESIYRVEGNPSRKKFKQDTR